MRPEFEERLMSYDKEHCWQYDIRINLEEEDKEWLKETFQVNTKDLSVNDFEFKLVTDKNEIQDCIEFIKRYEWLGTITQYSTHYFGAYFKGVLGGVIIFSMPNSFSKIMGESTKEIERLISRGACASWTPKCLASKFMMWSIKYMVKNTQYRLFTAYSDPSAKELGTIYQSCNFYYLGNKFGSTRRYISPYTGNVVSDRVFRIRSFYKHYAKELGIEWDKSWNSDTGMLWKNMPNDIEKKLREYSKYKQSVSQCIEVPHKHKYAYILGNSKLETKRLRERFEKSNKTYDYPHERGK